MAITAEEDKIYPVREQVIENCAVFEGANFLEDVVRVDDVGTVGVGTKDGAFLEFGVPV